MLIVRRLLAGSILCLAACSANHPGSPSREVQSEGADLSGSAPAELAPVDGTPVDPTAPERAAAVAPEFSFDGPQHPANCFKAGTDPMQWRLTVTDAGPSPLRFVALAHHDEIPGCNPTEKNPRPRITVSGTKEYAPHTSGQTAFTFDPRLYACGRVQVDVSIFDATGRETLMLGTVVDYGTPCDPPLACAPAFGSAPLNQPYAFRATGGTGHYTWSTVPASGAVPPTGTGAAFRQSYSVDGVYVATVRSGQQTATCQVVTQAF